MKWDPSTKAEARHWFKRLALTWFSISISRSLSFSLDGSWRCRFGGCKIYKWVFVFHSIGFASPVLTRDSSISSSPSVKFSSRFDMLGERIFSWRRLLNVNVPLISPVSGPSVVVEPRSCLVINQFYFSIWKFSITETHLSSASFFCSFVTAVFGIPFFSFATSTISFPRVLLRSRWFAFFSNCWWTLSRVVLYSRANSDKMRQKSFGLDSVMLWGGTPSQRRNLW